MDCEMNPSTPIWMFGYGSLLWKVNFPYEQSVVGYVSGFARRFWQASLDHRGTHHFPGRVATLVPSEDEKTWGIAYKVLPEDVPGTIAYLNNREKNGYNIHQVEFIPADNSLSPLTVQLYIATESNPSYVGPTDEAQLAQTIAHSRGESGCNVEYLMNLGKAIREIAPHVTDHHINKLERNVSELLEKRKQTQTQHQCTCQYCS